MSVAGFDSFDDFHDDPDTPDDESAARELWQALEAEAGHDSGDADALWQAIQDATGLIVDGTLDLVSGVDVPAIDSKWVMLKSDRDDSDWQTVAPILLSKDDGEEKRISYAPAMIPREPDKEGEVVPTPTVERMAHGFLADDGGIDTDHDLIDGKGTVVESWTLKEERTFELPDGGEESYPEGAWMLGVKWEAEPWQRIKAGELTGLSIYGMAEHLELSKRAGVEARLDAVEARLDALSDDDTDASGRTVKGGDTEPNGHEEPMTDPDTPDDPDPADADDGAGDDADGGPSLETVAESVDALADTVASIKDAVDTEKEPTTIDDLADEFDLSPDEVRSALEAYAAEDDDEEEDEEETANDADGGDGAGETEPAEKRATEANTAKGHDGEGTRTSRVENQQGDTAGTSGMPSYAEAAENYGGDD